MKKNKKYQNKKSEIKKESILLHKQYQGKIEINIKTKIRNKRELSLIYTPGVGAVASEIFKNKKLVNKLTNKKNSVAIITNGTAVLGLGNVGPEAALPVMEGKSVIFKTFADIDAIPICIKAKTIEEIVDFVKRIEPTFGGINLEDIAAPDCFEVVQRLEKELSIPVFHDDQDGTAIVVLAALINACRVLKFNLLKQKIVINGAGAAGIAITKLLLSYGIKNIIVLDSKGIIYQGRENLNKFKKEIAQITNQDQIKGGLKEALKGANIFIGVSKGGVLKKEMIKEMAKNPIIFALANPIPEIMPKEALSVGAGIVGTGRSDFPNQINNALVFPGIFRGILDNDVKIVTTEMKIKIAEAIAGYYVNKATRFRILPSIMDKKIIGVIVKAIKRSIK